MCLRGNLGPWTLWQTGEARSPSGQGDERASLTARTHSRTALFSLGSLGRPTHGRRRTNEIDPVKRSERAKEMSTGVHLALGPLGPLGLSLFLLSKRSGESVNKCAHDH